MRDDLQNDLDAYVLGDVDAQPVDADEAFEAPPDAEQANGMLRRLRGIEREVARINALADSEVRRIEEWRSDRTHGLTKRATAIEAALEQWWRAVNRVNPTRKSESLPNGKVALRSAGAGKVEITNPAAFETWWRQERSEALARYLNDHGMIEDTAAHAAEVLELVLSRSPLMRINPEPNKTGLKELDTGPAAPSPDGDPNVVHLPVGLDGEVIPGVAVVRSTVDTFKATPA